MILLLLSLLNDLVMWLFVRASPRPGRCKKCDPQRGLCDLHKRLHVSTSRLYDLVDNLVRAGLIAKYDAERKVIVYYKREAYISDPEARLMQGDYSNVLALYYQHDLRAILAELDKFKAASKAVIALRNTLRNYLNGC